MFDIPNFIIKIKEWVPFDNVIKTLEKLPKDEEFNQISSNAGSIGSAITIALHIIEKIYQTQIPIEKRLSLTVMRLLLEAAKDSLPYKIANRKIDKIVNKKNNFNDIVLELFDIKYNTNNEEKTIIHDIIDHPIFDKFRTSLVLDLEEYNINKQQFLTEFNSNFIIKLDQEKEKNNDISNFLNKWKINDDFYRLKSFLKNARKPFLDKDEIDNKSLSDYYVENQAYIVNKNTWNLNEESITKEKKWNIWSFLEGTDSLNVIAAPFGIGKSSLAKKIAFECSNKYIENPVDLQSYIPVFVDLKYGIESTCNNNSLDVDLKTIASHSIQKKNTKILVLLDGLDELSDSKHPNRQNIYFAIEKYRFDYPQTKFIITTRLEAGFPSLLNIKENYIRLFSFDDLQIKDFFQTYHISIEYKDILEVFKKNKLGKPLFCWMIAIVYEKSLPEERRILFNYSAKGGINEISLYQYFIHNVIFGKPRHSIDDENLLTGYKNEKKALRLIAFLKHDRPSISKIKIEEFLNSTGLKLPKSTKSLLSDYIGISQNEEGEEKLEFNHKSFQEYLLAEFYIESIINSQYHRLIGDLPTPETFEFLYGLIKLIKTDNLFITKNSKNFLKTFLSKDDEEELDNDVKKLRGILKTNSVKFVIQQNLLPVISEDEMDIWKYFRLGYSNLNKIWVSRWIGLYIAGNMIDDDRLDKEFIECSSFIVKNCVSFMNKKILNSVNIQCIDLANTNLSSIDLSNSNLSNANLSNTNLSSANLSNTNLSSANLFNANLSHSNLSNTNLSSANLFNANLSNTNIYETDFTNADLSGANLSLTFGITSAKLYDTIMNCVDFSNLFNIIEKRIYPISDNKLVTKLLGHGEGTILTENETEIRSVTIPEAKDLDTKKLFSNFTYGAKISIIVGSDKFVGGNFSNTKFIAVNFSHLDLSNTKFIKSNLSHSNLSFVDLSKSDLSYANLSYANLSYTNLSHVNLRSADLSNSIILNPDYLGLEIDEKSNFQNSLTNSYDFVEYLNSKKINSLPTLVTKTDQILSKLKDNTYYSHLMDTLTNFFNPLKF